MKSKSNITLNGKRLSDIDPRIFVQTVEEKAPVISLTAVTRGGLGQFVTGRRRDTMDVTATFVIMEKDMNKRASILENVNAWAVNGGWLAVSHKQNRRLRVACTALPAAGISKDWTQEYTVTFRAFLPYWQSEATTTLATWTAASKSESVYAPGTMPTVMTVSVSNTGATINNLYVKANGKGITFSSLGLGNGETLLIRYTDDGIQQLVIRGSNNVERSVLNKRTSASEDDIVLNVGANSVQLNADHSVAWVLKCTGRFA